MLTFLLTAIAVCDTCPKFFADSFMCPGHNTRRSPKVLPGPNIQFRQINVRPALVALCPTKISARKIWLRIQRDQGGTNALQSSTYPHREIAVQQPSALPLKAQDPASTVFLRMPSVMLMTGLGRSTIYRLMAQQQFPCPVRLGVRAVAWRRSELNEWSQTRPAASHWANTAQSGQLPQPTSVWKAFMTTTR